MKRQIAIYPGTFDPITFGHIDVINRGVELFSEVIVLVAKNTTKTPLFTIDERLAMIREVLRDKKGVSVDCFDGLLVDYARRHKAGVIIRGLRAVSDFEYEFQMALTNRRLGPDIETVFLMPSENYSYLSSKLLKETSRYGADISSYVPSFIEHRLKEKLRK